MANIFFTSDTHFFHTNIIKYCNRPFENAEEMNEVIIRNWNSVVNYNDVVYHLGDFILGITDKVKVAKSMRERLNGDIHFIMGNHDPKAWRTNPEDRPRFLSLKDYDEITVDGQPIVLFHYGMRTWHHDLRGTWQLYGHSHGGLPPYGKSMDVGVDSNNFTPIAFEDLKVMMDKLEVGDHPKFAEYDPQKIGA